MGGFDRVVSSLRASLEPEGVALCPAAPEGRGTPPVAEVYFTALGQSRVRVDVEITDPSAPHRSSRVLDLGALPDDGRPMALAIAADELLRTARREGDRPPEPPAEPSPPPVVADDTVGEPVAVPPRRTWLGAGFAYEHYGGGQDHLGLDVRATVKPWPIFGVDAKIGYRRGLGVRAPGGRILSDAIVIGLGVEVGTPRRARRFGIAAGTGVDALVVFFRAEPGVAGVGARPARDLAMVWRAELAPWVRLSSRAQLELRAGAGIPVRSVEALDRGAPVTGISRFTVTTALGLRVGI